MLPENFTQVEVQILPIQFTVTAMNSLSDVHIASGKPMPTFLNVKEVAALLRVKPRTIYEMVAQRRIPYRKPEGSNILRFDLDEILEWTKVNG